MDTHACTHTHTQRPLIDKSILRVKSIVGGIRITYPKLHYRTIVTKAASYRYNKDR